MIYLDLIPMGAAGHNLRQSVPTAEWRAISKRIRDESGGTCDGCGESFPVSKLQCHEAWERDDAEAILTLIAFRPLCQLCHDVVHYNQSAWVKDYSDAFEHLCRVNGWTTEQAQTHVDEAWVKRNEDDRFWVLDLSYAEKRFGCHPCPQYIRGGEGGSTILGADPNAIAQDVFERSRTRRIAVFADPRGYFCWGQLIVYGINPDEQRLIRHFKSMKHRDGSPVGYYDREATTQEIAADIAPFIERVEERARVKAEKAAAEKAEREAEWEAERKRRRGPRRLNFEIISTAPTTTPPVKDD